ncbi:MAG: aspartate aminotransferase family protein [Chitinophagia bacterium]|nr:aspartate aminotransferase family protein [Chitinophagia bacterium]
MNIRSQFLNHLAQTSDAPLALDIVKAQGNYLYDRAGKAYLDLIGGISVCNVGHTHPKVVAAIQKQAASYLHVMVYGELIQSPQVDYASQLAQLLPAPLSAVYFTNSGSEATEGAIKLARRVTGKVEIVAAHKSYHGSTLGALSVMGDEYWRNAFRPLMPGVWHHDYNSEAFLNAINEKTACVIIEAVQAESGVHMPDKEWMQALRKKCSALGALLIVDEIQTGFGRTGKMWGFEHSDIIPDIVLLGKALGGGMPLGAFVASKEHMQHLTNNPVLGHITTFGGHPVSCAAGIAALEVLREEQLIEQIEEKSKLFVEALHHEKIKQVRSKGLLIAIELESSDLVLASIQGCLANNLFSDWFLFAPNCIRIAPPLTINLEEIKIACTAIKQVLSSL